MTVTAKKAAHPFPTLHPPFLLLALIFLGTGAGLFLWLLCVLPAELPRSWVNWGYALLVLAALKSAALSVVLTGLGRAGFGLTAAIVFPMLALTWAYREMDRLAAAAPAKPVWPAIRGLLITTGITLVGALMIAAMLSESSYLVKVGQFAGVKAALAVPLLLFGLLLITEGVARPGETLATYWARCVANLRAFLSKPLYLWGIAVAGVVLLIVGLMLARSGNDGGVGVSTTELHLRSILERIFIARPRTKEFLLGNPLFFIGLVAAVRRQRVLAALLLIGGAIGQVDILNTFCHAHTPVLLSLLRIINGLWLGVAIGVVALWLFWRQGIQEKAPAKAE